MKVDVVGTDAKVFRALRVSVVRRVHLALSRFGPRVREVNVSLTEPANLLGGVDQRCRMRARLRDGDDVHADVINGGFEEAVARAAAHLAKRVQSALNGDAKQAFAPAGGLHAAGGRVRGAVTASRRTRDPGGPQRPGARAGSK